MELSYASGPFQTILKPYLLSEVFMLVQISGSWQSLNALTGIAAGVDIAVQSQSSSRVYMKQQDTQPDSGSMDAAIMDFKDWMQITGDKVVWVRVDDVSGQLYVEVL